VAVGFSYAHPVPADLDHLAAIEPLALRVATARERLRSSASIAAGHLEVVLLAARQGDARARRSLLACCIALVQAGSEPWAQALERQASDQSLPALAALFGDVDPHHAIRWPGRLPDPCVSRERAALVSRSSLTQRLQTRWMLPLDRILAHPDPQVVRGLLRSPALRLPEALAIAARRPTSDALVDELTHSLRWMARVEVRQALVANPFVRPRVALLLLPTILAPARRALGRGAVHPLVRAAAAADP
jgi:hypothetical protein